MKKQYTFEIDIKVVSPFQFEFAKKALYSVLVAWKDFMNRSHKKNNVTIFVDGHNLKNLDWLP